MFQLFAITFSQGLQAFLPVALLWIWSARAPSSRSRHALLIACVAAVPSSVVAGLLYQRAAHAAAIEAALAIAALAVSVPTWRRLDAATTAVASPALSSGLLIAAAATFFIVRQEMETAVVLDAAILQVRSLPATASAAAGLTLAAVLAVVEVALAARLSAASIRRGSNAFLLVWVPLLAVYAFHELCEARLLPLSDLLHQVTEPYGPDGLYGRWAALLLLAAPAVAVILPAPTRVGAPAFRLAIAGAMRTRRSAIGAACAAGLLAIAALTPDMRIETKRGLAAAASPLNDPEAEIAAAVRAPHLLFRSTALDASYGRVAIAALDGPNRARTVTSLRCERVYFAGGRGLCLDADRGFFTTYSASVFDATFRVQRTLKLDGGASRTRVSADGRLAAFTVFVVGHAYSGAFSTHTELVDATAGDALGNLEEFSVWRDGARFEGADFNFWGITFTRDASRFYATLATRGQTYLVEGDTALRRMRVLRSNVECPSLSPDNRRLAFKKRVDGTRVAWRLAMLELPSLAERLVSGETRSVDDQAEWLDDGRLLYAMPDERDPVHTPNIWVVPIDGSRPAQILLRQAESPAVVR